MVSIVLTGIFLTFCSVTGAERPTVKVEQGTLQGVKLSTVWGKEYLSFRGIRYARPPVGELRFQAPKEPQPWEGTYNATDAGHQCPQRNPIINEVEGNEDCLFLNVYTHKLPEKGDGLRAVMVWIHGGGFKMGTPAPTMYGPDHLLEEDLVIVAIGYRLGILGFLSLPEAAIPGNNGMKDQVMALRWVQQNIAQFGGDPNRVTIFGQSAGGASVHYHLLSPMSKGLFHGAISQSGSALDPWAFNEPDVLRKEAFEYGKKIGCNTTDSVQLYDCFRQQPAESLVDEIQMKAEFTPTRETSKHHDEETFLTEYPRNVISDGKFHNVPYVVGVVAYESAFFTRFVTLPHDTDTEKYLRNLARLLPLVPENTTVEYLTPNLKSVYYSNNTATEDGTIDLLTDIWFLCGADQTGKGHAATSSSPVYYYYFTYDGDLAFRKQILGLLSSKKGPIHADELGYLFRSHFAPELDTESQDVKILRRMVKMWANFAKYGDPTSRMESELNVKWNCMTKTDNLYLKIDKEVSMQRDLQRDRMALCRKTTNVY